MNNETEDRLPDRRRAEPPERMDPVIARFIEALARAAARYGLGQTGSQNSPVSGSKLTEAGTVDR